LQISNLSPATLAWDWVQAGKDLYVDRGYQFQDPIPSDLLDQLYIKMPNAEKDDPNFTLGFSVNQTVTVVVAEDELITTPPQWLQGWTKRGDQMLTSDAVSLRTLYEKRFPAGTITLGANHAPGMFEGRSMYSIIVLSSKNGAGHWQLYP
jgi:hypothetical protein